MTPREWEEPGRKTQAPGGPSSRLTHLQGPSSGEEAQADLFAYADQLASNARDTALAVTERNDAEWVEMVLDWIYDLPAGTEVHADGVQAVHGRSAAIGSVIRTASRRGVLEAVGLRESNAITRHKGLQRTWVRT